MPAEFALVPIFQLLAATTFLTSGRGSFVELDDFLCLTRL